MKKLLLAALVAFSFTEGAEPASAAPSATTTMAKVPNQMARTRRRLRRQAAQRMRHNKHTHRA